MIENGKIVSVHYTGKLQDGEVFDSSEGREPLQFEIGSGQIIPGFENAILGKEVGDKVTANIKPEEGYGLIREDLLVNIPKDRMPGDVQIGQALEASGEDGQPGAQVFVKEIHEDHVIIDANHPLAGKDMVFDIEIISIN